MLNEVKANPLRSIIMDGAEFVRKNNCDFIVVLGGDSGMGKTNGKLEKSCSGAKLVAGRLLNRVSVSASCGLLKAM